MFGSEGVFIMMLPRMSGQEGDEKRGGEERRRAETESRSGTLVVGLE